mmetsp:Transcript_18395/g.51998  ORF Transcript_18395/g.51998 Transcript_18395/m.51998 type:complete len:175 (+) Transcript_18395:95-619(+)
MSAELVDALSAISLEGPEEEQQEPSRDCLTMQVKVTGGPSFDLELDSTMAIRDVKKLAKEHCNIEPEHMRLIYKDQVLKDADTLAAFKSFDAAEPLRMTFTAGHTALKGGTKPQLQQRNPFVTPVRGLPGSKGNRPSRMSGRLGGMGLIRCYGIMMKRQEFREKATEIGFQKYR